LALAVGGCVFAVMKHSLGWANEYGAASAPAVLIAIIAVAVGLNTNVLTRLSLVSTTSLEQGLRDRLQVSGGASASASPAMMSALR